MHILFHVQTIHLRTELAYQWPALAAATQARCTRTSRRGVLPGSCSKPRARLPPWCTGHVQPAAQPSPHGCCSRAARDMIPDVGEGWSLMQRHAMPGPPTPPSSFWEATRGTSRTAAARSCVTLPARSRSCRPLRAGDALQGCHLGSQGTHLRRQGRTAEGSAGCAEICGSAAALLLSSWLAPPIWGRRR